MARTYDANEWQWIVSADAASLGDALSTLFEESSDASEWLIRDEPPGPDVRFEVRLGAVRLGERAFFEQAAARVELHSDLARFVEHWSTLAGADGERLYAWHDDLRPVA